MRKLFINFYLLAATCLAIVSFYLAVLETTDQDKKEFLGGTFLLSLACMFLMWPSTRKRDGKEAN